MPDLTAEHMDFVKDTHEKRRDYGQTARTQGLCAVVFVKEPANDDDGQAETCQLPAETLQKP